MPHSSLSTHIGLYSHPMHSGTALKHSTQHSSETLMHSSNLSKEDYLLANSDSKPGKSLAAVGVPFTHTVGVARTPVPVRLPTSLPTRIRGNRSVGKSMHSLKSSRCGIPARSVKESRVGSLLGAEPR